MFDLAGIFLAIFLPKCYDTIMQKGDAHGSTCIGGELW